MKQEIRKFISVNKPIENPSIQNGCKTNRPKTASKINSVCTVNNRTKIATMKTLKLL